MNAQLFKSRSSFVVSALIFWAVIICLFLFYFSFVKRDRYIQSRDTLSKRTGVIIAERGTLYDKNGIQLAWNETSYDLVISSPPKNELVASQMMIEVRAVAGGWFNYYGYLGEGAVLIPDLAINIMEEIKVLCDRYPRNLAVKRRFSRQYIKKGDVRFAVGSVSDDELMSGISGFELLYDELLRGTNGEYSVMVDRSGQWLPGEWKELTKPIAGEDITLKLSAAELENEY